MEADYHPLPMGQLGGSVGVTGVLTCRGSRVNVSIKELLSQVTCLCVPLHPLNSLGVPVPISTSFGWGCSQHSVYRLLGGLNKVNTYETCRLVSGKDPMHVSCKLWYFLNK